MSTEAQIGNNPICTTRTTNYELQRTKNKQNYAKQTQFQTQADVFFKILPHLSIITRILPSHWPACPIIQPAKDDELLTLLVNLHLNPADKPDRNSLQAQNAQTFHLKNVETTDPKRANS